MKKTSIILFFLIGIYFTIKAQGNLQFNQILTYNGSAQTSPLWTVPAGKAWKIENVLIVSMSSPTTFKINNTTVLYNNSSTGPIWLKSGDNCQFNSSNTGDTFFLSIIEFNITP